MCLCQWLPVVLWLFAELMRDWSRWPALVDNYGTDWIMMCMFTPESMSWCFGAFFVRHSRLLFLKGLHFKPGADVSFNRDSHCCSLVSSVAWSQVPGVFELSHEGGLQGVLLGDKPDHCTERAFVCVRPTHVLLGPFLSPLTSLSVPWPVGAGRLNVMTPFFPPCHLTTLLSINFHSAFTEIPGLSRPALISNTCPKDTH